ncbi:MAG: hypothetical protein WC820_08995 [Spirochaetales bacterium]
MPPMNHRNAKHHAIAPSPRSLALGDFALGATIGAICLGASFLAGAKLIGKLYYVEWLAVSIMGFLLLIAWFLYLRDDAFMRRHGGKDVGENASPRSNKRARRILFAAAAFLGLSSLILYFRFGIGASL